jgi:hypothetical protein
MVAERNVRQLLRDVPARRAIALWIGAVSHPVATLEHLLNITKAIDRITELIKLSSSSCAVSLLVTTAVGWLIQVPAGELLPRTLARFLAIVIMMLGGVACHLIFRMFGLPSRFTTTLLIYAVPQALLLPILAALSSPFISLEHIILAGMPEQSLSIFESFKYAVMTMGARIKEVQTFQTIGIASGWISAILMIVFLEGYWQHYRILRTKVYSVGTLSWIINLVIIALPIPLNVVLVYRLR